MVNAGIQELTTFKADLMNLAKSIEELYNAMNVDVSHLGEQWQDQKYEEYLEGYMPQLKKVEEISARYSEWCEKVIQPLIDRLIAIGDTSVGGDDGGSSNSGSGADSSSNGSSGGGLKPDKKKVFQEGSQKVKAIGEENRIKNKVLFDILHPGRGAKERYR